MAINAYVGLPRSGKSHSAVEFVILPGLEKGRRIWTNIPLNAELLEQEYPGKVTQFKTQDVIDEPKWFQEVFEKGATIIIDECWRLWPSGTTAKQAREGDKSFLAEHGHMVGEDGFVTEVVLVTQDLAQIANFARSLVEFTYRSVKLSAVGADKSYRIDVYQGSVTGPQPPKSQRTRQMFSKYKPEVYRYYTSQTMSDTGQHGDELATDDRSNIFNSKLITRGYPLAFVVLLVIVFYGFNAVRSKYMTSEEQPQPIAQESKVPPVPQPRPKPKHRHFYEGMDAYIAFNMGVTGWVDYRIGFRNKEKHVVLDTDQLGKMGYRVVGFDPCFVQLVGHGATVNVFCEPPEEESDDRTVFDL